jgi:hypothetical protein
MAKVQAINADKVNGADGVGVAGERVGPGRRKGKGPEDRSSGPSLFDLVDRT